MREWLKKARASKGKTMKQVADELHISEGYYCYIEKGLRKRNMDISLAERLSLILDIPMKQILEEEAKIKESA